MKESKYSKLLDEIITLTSVKGDAISVMANASAMIHEEMDFWWTGFYLVQNDELILGPFQGSPACSKIAFGKGVCGTCWKKGETVIVDDVEEFPGHIACSSESKSEIVVPVFVNGSVYAVLDIDSKCKTNFDSTDKIWLEKIACVIGKVFSENYGYNFLKRLLIKDRTYRVFNEEIPIDGEKLKRLVELTRFCASGRNAQPLKYIVIHKSEDREEVYQLLKWAGYYPDWDGPEPGKRPSAYLVQCLDTDLSKDCLCDDGLQLQAITLGATAIGLGCCIIKSFDIQALKNLLSIPDNLVPQYVLALGVPAQEVRMEDTDGTKQADFRYYMKDGVHTVPKRPLNEILLY